MDDKEKEVRCTKTLWPAVLIAAGLTVLGLWGCQKASAHPSQDHQETTEAALGRLTARDLAEIDLGMTPPSPWEEPPVVSSVNGQLHATLDVRFAKNKIKIGDNEYEVYLRSYNGLLTGPTFRAKAGDTLHIHLKNNLPEEPAMHMPAGGVCADPTHGFNTTNLHTHGLHISPQENSDNVELEIKPGKEQRYEFKILPAPDPEPGAAQHYPGTFWYHAHHHGSTATQLASGMAGALIIEGDIDEVPEIKAARERLFVFQQLAFDKKTGEVLSFNGLKKGYNNPTIINGRVKPLITMRPGQVERWRFIDTGIFEDLPIEIRPGPLPAGEFKIYRIALDGITRPKPERLQPAPGKRDQVVLGPGYRVDLLVQAPDSQGLYYLYKDKSKFSLMGENPPPGINDQQILAEIRVEGKECTEEPACSTKIPASLPAPTKMLPDIKKEELTSKEPVPVDFTIEKGFFKINGSCFDDEVRKEFRKTKGHVEEWHIVNHTPMPHPFHIHVNAFQVLDQNGNPGEWRDTILVPPKKGGQPGVVKFRTRFERFTGRFVLHCHILTHEDQGMMQRVEIRDKWPQEAVPGGQP